MRVRSIVTVATACAAAMLAACTVHKTEAPPLGGPSELALSLSMTATPDSISLDGGSQSAVKIVARGPDGRPVASLPLRVDMTVNDVPQDFGTLSARSVVTGGDGSATVMYTAPRQSQGANPGTCNSLPGTCVTIVATPTGSNFQTANPQIVEIRLVPPGVILPPADTPTAIFKFSPDAPAVSDQVLFDGTASCAGAADQSGNCLSTRNVISRFDWDFGDGTTGSGPTATHSYSAARPYAVTLTVTNDRGVAASKTVTVPVSQPAGPSASFVFSPNSPQPDDVVIFTDTSKPVPGRNNVRFDWNFGDPDKPSGGTASGNTVTNSYHREGTFVVTLTVTDDLGQKSVATQSVTVSKPK
jgi:PKD domain-containing protein